MDNHSGGATPTLRHTSSSTSSSSHEHSFSSSSSSSSASSSSSSQSSIDDDNDTQRILRSSIVSHGILDQSIGPFPSSSITLPSGPDIHILTPSSTASSSSSTLPSSSSSTTTTTIDSTITSPSSSLPVKESMVSTETEHFRTYIKHDKYLLLHKLIYFIGMGANASIYPFIVIRWRSIGLTDLQAGSIMAMAHMANLAISPLVGSLADRSEKHRRGVLIVGFLAACLFGFLLGYANNFWSALFMYLAMDTCVTNVWPILDSSVYAILESTTGHTEGYGANRAFGALGWGVWAWISGVIFDIHGLDKMFITFFLALLPVVPLVYRLPVEKRKATKQSATNAWKRIATLDVLIFVVVVYITAVLLNLCDVYRSPYLAEMGASNELLGFSITATSISEFPFFFVATWVLKRVSIPMVLLSVLLAYAVRFWYYSIIYDPWLTIPAELLHGVQFALGWAASTNYVAQLLPPELSSTAQALLATVQWGLGSSTGALLGGALMDEYGGRNMFRSGAVLALFGAAIMGMSIYRKYRANHRAVQLQDDTEEENSTGDDPEKNNTVTGTTLRSVRSSSD